MRSCCPARTAVTRKTQSKRSGGRASKKRDTARQALDDARRQPARFPFALRSDWSASWRRPGCRSRLRSRVGRCRPGTRPRRCAAPTRPPQGMGGAESQQRPARERSAPRRNRLLGGTAPDRCGVLAATATLLSGRASSPNRSASAGQAQRPGQGRGAQPCKQGGCGRKSTRTARFVDAAAVAAVVGVSAVQARKQDAPPERMQHGCKSCGPHPVTRQRESSAHGFLSDVAFSCAAKKRATSRVGNTLPALTTMPPATALLRRCARC